MTLTFCREQKTSQSKPVLTRFERRLTEDCDGVLKIRARATRVSEWLLPEHVMPCYDES